MPQMPDPITPTTTAKPIQPNGSARSDAPLLPVEPEKAAPLEVQIPLLPMMDESAEPILPKLQRELMVEDRDAERIPLWLQRIELFLRVLLRLVIGCALFAGPWCYWLWDQNPIFLHFPTLSIYAANGAVRGIISGLGLLNLWIAIQDALHGSGSEKPEKRS